jgi:tryptophan synthase, alpha subunit
MNRIDTLFETKKEQILSVFFTAGHPSLNDTLPIIQHLENAGADLVEVGMPFSDPMADGSTIQHSSKVALQNGMSLEVLFKQLELLRLIVTIPVVLMGYFNPVMKFGVERFIFMCQKVGVDGVIIPDLPLDIFRENYCEQFIRANVHNVLLATPTACKERLQMLAAETQGFLYMVSSGSTTGGGLEPSRLVQLQIATGDVGNRAPILVGFGVKSHADFETVSQYGRGAVVGSAFIKLLEDSTNFKADIEFFVKSIKG